MPNINIGRRIKLEDVLDTARVGGVLLKELGHKLKESEEELKWQFWDYCIVYCEECGSKLLIQDILGDVIVSCIEGGIGSCADVVIKGIIQ